MELNEYQKKAMSTCMKSCENDAYMFFGLVGEVGELTSKIAKAIRQDKIAFDDDNSIHFRWMGDESNEEFIEGLEGEIGDCMWFLAGICTMLGFDLEEVAQRNLAKLKSRQQRGVIDGNGDNR